MIFPNFQQFQRFVAYLAGGDPQRQRYSVSPTSVRLDLAVTSLARNLLTVILSTAIFSGICTGLAVAQGAATPTAAAATAAKPIPVLLTYRSSILSSRLAYEGAKVRLSRALAVPLELHELDLDTPIEPGNSDSAVAPAAPISGSALARRKLTESKAVAVVALEPAIDSNFLPIVDSLGLVVISSTLTDAGTANPVRGLYSVYPRIEGAKEAVQRFLISQPTVKSWYLLCSNEPLGLAYSSLWDTVSAERKVQSTSSNCSSEKAFDFRVNFIRARSQKVGGIAVGFGALAVLQRLREMNWVVPVMLSAVEAERLLRSGVSAPVPPEGETVFFDAPVLSDLFVTLYGEQFGGVQPTISNYLGYEAVDTLIRALVESQALGGDLRGAMRQLRYDGVAGEMDYRGSTAGNLAKSVLMQFEQGVAVRVN